MNLYVGERLRGRRLVTLLKHLSYKTQVMLADGSPVPCFLLANKCDVIEDIEEFETKKVLFDKFVQEKGFTVSRFL